MSEVGDEVSPAKIKNICKDEDETFMNGLCNGTRLEITYLHRKCVQAKIIYGQNAGSIKNKTSSN